MRAQILREVGDRLVAGEVAPPRPGTGEGVAIKSPQTITKAE